MTLLGTSDLAYMRGEAEYALPDLIDIAEVTHTADGQGGVVDSYGMKAQNVAARLSERAAGANLERIVGEQVQVVSDWMLTVPYDTGITETDRVSHDGRQYEVIYVNTERSHDTVRRCLLRRMA